MVGGGLIELGYFDCCGGFDLCGLPERLSSFRFRFGHGELESGNWGKVEVMLPTKRSVSMRASFCARDGTGMRTGR